MMNLMNRLEFHADKGHLALNFIIIVRLKEILNCSTWSRVCTHQGAICDLLEFGDIY